MATQLPISLLKLVYPLQEPNLKRTKPLQVLCLGLGRTGTDSLRTALYELGYNEVYHGFRAVEEAHVGQVIQWVRLGRGIGYRKLFLSLTLCFCV